MKLPERYFKNENIHWIFQDTNGNILMDSSNLLLDGLCIHHDKNDMETYSFRPLDSGKFNFWCNSDDIVKIEN